MAVAAVYQDVARLEQGQKLIYHLIDRRARLNHHQDAARLFQAGDKRFERIGAENVLALGGAFDKAGDGFGRAGIDGHGETVALHIERKVAAHDGGTDKTDILHGNIPPYYLCCQLS